MEDFEWKYKNLEAHLRYNAKNLVLSIEAQNAESTFDVFIVFYKWIIADNLFLAVYEDKKSFEKVNIEGFQLFFINQNIHYEKLLPSYTILKTFFWEVIDSGYEKHLKSVEKQFPDLHNNTIDPSDNAISDFMDSIKG
ncbi:hypothetical protein JW887_00630 [Candidatus Dojkabacteria bacterium]|nr:hypothetical protein [Candidatus Dojkabacteria bacterium]